jgi:hypothetical protein
VVHPSGYERCGKIGYTIEARKFFFFEKKKQKTFVHLADAVDTRSADTKLIKVFWFFFSKKNCSLTACLPFSASRS